MLRKHWQCQSGDIFVATYPKAGTTWLQTVVLLLLHQGDSEQVFSVHACGRVNVTLRTYYNFRTICSITTVAV